jgi:streptomycin 6-kinase
MINCYIAIVQPFTGDNPHEDCVELHNRGWFEIDRKKKVTEFTLKYTKYKFPGGVEKTIDDGENVTRTYYMEK